MARQVIFLEDMTPDDAGSVNQQVAYWIDPRTSQQAFFAQAGATGRSAVKDATTLELEALRTGAVTEVVETIVMPSGTSRGALENESQQRYNALRNAIRGSTRFRWSGSSWDGTTWTRLTNTT